MFTSTIPATKNGQENIFGYLTRRIRRHGEFSAGEYPWYSTRTAGLGGAGGAPRSRRALELRGARRDYHCPFLREDESWTSCNHFWLPRRQLARLRSPQREPRGAPTAGPAHQVWLHRCAQATRCRGGGPGGYLYLSRPPGAARPRVPLNGNPSSGPPSSEHQPAGEIPRAQRPPHAQRARN